MNVSGSSGVVPNNALQEAGEGRSAAGPEGQADDGEAEPVAQNEIQDSVALCAESHPDAVSGGALFDAVAGLYTDSMELTFLPNWKTSSPPRPTAVGSRSKRWRERHWSGLWTPTTGSSARLRQDLPRSTPARSCHTMRSRPAWRRRWQSTTPVADVSPLDRRGGDRRRASLSYAGGDAR